MSEKVAGRKILVTGGAGFIGSHLVGRLVEANEIVILDNLHRDAIKTTGLLENKHVRLIRGDVQDPEIVATAISGCDAVVHLASIAGVDTVIRSPVKTMRVGLVGTMNLLSAAVASGRIRRFIDFSTSEVFGRYAYKVSEGDITQLGVVGEARWTYAVAKLATEHLAMCYHKEHGLPAVSIRPFNIYGPGQVGEGAVHAFIVRALRDEPLMVHNDGSQIRAWCYVDDIIDALMLCLNRPQAVGQVFNIGNARSAVTIHTLAREIIRIANSKAKIDFIQWNFPDVELRIPSVHKAKTILGFEAKIELEEGLRRTIDWYRHQDA
jgi:nucleoside-diphosphate-sugar epimerase